MLKCLFIKRKLYDYLENNLSDIDMVKVHSHLDVCHKCNQSLSQIKSILDLASQKKTPEPTEEFWRNFKIDLDRKLNAGLVPPINLERRLSYRFRPVFVCATVLIFILLMGNYLYKNIPSNLRYAQENEDVVEETELLDEIGKAEDLNDNEDTYLDEIDLFYQLDIDLT